MRAVGKPSVRKLGRGVAHDYTRVTFEPDLSSACARVTVPFAE